MKKYTQEVAQYTYDEKTKRNVPVLGEDGKPVMKAEPFYVINQDDVEKMYAQHQEWQKDHTKGKKMNLWHCSGKNLDFSGKDLSGDRDTFDTKGDVVAHNATELAHATLKDCNFDGAKLDNVNFTRSNLSGSTIRNTQIQNANFYGTKFPNAKLENVKLQGSNLARADLSQATWVHGVEMSGGSAQGLKLTEKQSKGLSFDASVKKPPKKFIQDDLKAARSEVSQSKAKTAERSV